MGNITIRNPDDRVIEAWKAQAKTNHRSLEAELRHELTQRVNRRLIMAVFRERTAGTRQTGSTDFIREDRDR
ncbi:MAG: hypothetical protein OXC54_02130 [Rhodospirillaceae bacterium]|nr:hypothetical protein [Rhodospirillaceae bacterium]